METTQTTTMTEFIDHNQIKMSAQRVDINPNMADSHKMDNYKIVLLAGRSRMTTYFSKGFGHSGIWPTIPEVLDCLASDSATVENSPTFEDFASELGYDSDSRKAEKTYQICQRQSAKLRKLLGDSAYETLVWNVERL